MDNQLFFWITLAAPLVAVVIFNASWRRGLERNVFSYPFEVFTYVFFIIVPAANVFYDEYVTRSLFFGDPAKSMAYLNLLNAAGLCIAAVAASWIRLPEPKPAPARWSTGNIQAMLAIALIVSLGLGIYNNFIAGNLRESGDAATSAGIGLYAVIESAPLLLAWLTVVSVWHQQRFPSKLAGFLLTCLFLVVAVGMNFSRGSRVTVLLVVIVSMQLFHQYVFRLHKAFLVGLLIVGAGVFNLMTVYKHIGVDGLESYLGGHSAPAYVEERYTNPVRIVVGDIGRADIQASILEAEMAGQIPHVHGRTYLKALTLILPDSLDPFPEEWGKVSAGASAQISIDPDVELSSNDTWGISSSRIYGVVGEALLNFGWMGALLSFVVVGLVTRRCIVWANQAGPWWDKGLVAPVVSLVPILILFYDFDNIVFRLVMILGLPGGLLLLNRFLSQQVERPHAVMR